LDIFVECPPSSDMLNFISVHNCVIRSLVVHAFGKYTAYPARDEDFRDLNLGSLEDITFMGISSEETLMDLALRSSHKKMTLRLKTGAIKPSLLRHNLIQRVINLYIFAGKSHIALYKTADQKFQELMEPLVSKIALPNARSVEILGDHNMINAFDLRDSSFLQFHGVTRVNHSFNINFSSLSKQTKDISLQCAKFASKPARPYLFGDLTHLRLYQTRIHGRVDDYLEFPNLEHLALEKVTSLNNGVQINDLNQLLSVDVFRRVPVLRTITLDSMSIGRSFVEGLESCKRLEAINLESCDIGDFVVPFLYFLQSNESLPSLEALYIHTPRNDMNGIFEAFGQCYLAMRPNVAAEKRNIWLPNNISSLSRLSHDLYIYNSRVYR
jgi:hypothetical protein